MKRRKKAANRRRPRHQQKRRPVPLPPVRLPNEYDDAVIEQLRSAPLGTLKLDRFAEFLKGKPASDDGAIAVLRSALIKVYEQAAWFRAEARTSNEKIKSAEAGLDSLWKAASHLEQVQPKHRRGLAAAFAPPSDDPKGRDESTEFSAFCSQTRLDVVQAAQRLHQLIRNEKAKNVAKGERKKRLRILTEALAVWWIRATGKSIAPYVQTKPLGKGRTFVARRSGRFVEFAASILSDLDQFTRNEVVSAITNVYERRHRKSARRPSR